jgi:hypothetical protein
MFTGWFAIQILLIFVAAFASCHIVFLYQFHFQYIEAVIAQSVIASVFISNGAQPHRFCNCWPENKFFNECEDESVAMMIKDIFNFILNASYLGVRFLLLLYHWTQTVSYIYCMVSRAFSC